MGRKEGRWVGDGHWLGARRLWYKGADGEGRGCGVERSICSRWSRARAVVSAPRMLYPCSLLVIYIHL